MNEVNDVEQLVMRQREYAEAIQPYIDMKVKVYAVSLPTTIVYSDGRVEQQYNFTPELEQQLRIADEMIAMARAKYLGA